MPRDAGVYPDFDALDAFGVPANMLGAHTEEMYGAVARIVMLSALLEDLQRTLLQTLTRTGQDGYASTPASQVVASLRQEVRDAANIRAEWREAGVLLDRTAEILRFRHGVVHNLWPAQDDGTVFGHRLVPATATREGFPLAMTDMREAVLTLVDLIKLTQQWLGRATEIAHLRAAEGRG